MLTKTLQIATISSIIVAPVYIFIVQIVLVHVASYCCSTAALPLTKPHDDGEKSSSHECPMLGW